MGVLAGRLGLPLWGCGSGDPRLTPYFMALTALSFMTNALAPPPCLGRLSLGISTWSRLDLHQLFGATTRMVSKADLHSASGGNSLPVCLLHVCEALFCTWPLGVRPGYPWISSRSGQLFTVAATYTVVPL